MQLKQLRHLVAVAEQGSFGRAAEVVHLSQPALSRSIDSLEAALGAPLVDRAYGTARLTAAGERVAARAAQLLQDADEIQRDVQRLAQLEDGELRVGMGPFAAAVLGRPALAALVARHPRLRLQIEVGGSVAQLRELLERRLVDVLLVDSRHLEHLPGLRVTRLPDVATGFFVRARHPLLARERPVLRDALDYPVAAPNLPEHALEFFGRKLKGAPRALFTIACNDLATLRHIALHSDTLVFSPRGPVADIATASLHPVEFTGLPAMRTRYSLVQPVDRASVPAVAAFEAAVRTQAAR